MYLDINCPWDENKISSFYNVCKGVERFLFIKFIGVEKKGKLNVK